jgi:hypothetical protein
MKHFSRVHVFDALHGLVNDVSLVNVFENVSLDHCVQVRLHVVKDQINVSVVFSSNYVLQLDNVVVAVQFLKENNFSEGSLSIRGILKSIEYLLESDYLLGLFVNCLPNYTICAFP